MTDWNYVVRAADGGLEISGIAIASPFGTADVPTHFEHTNVVAAFLPNPVVIDRIQRDGDSLLFHSRRDFVPPTDRKASRGHNDLA